MDHKTMETLNARDQYLEKLWEQLEDVPVDPETERLEKPFLHFPVGTEKEDIWHWFDERHSKGITHLLYRDGTDRTAEIAEAKYFRLIYKGFTSPERMVEIAQNAIDSFGELLCEKPLYDALSGSLKMTDEEIIAAGFNQLTKYCEPREIGSEEADAIIEDRNPCGKFFLQEGGVWVGLDNCTGDCWVEEFQTKEECLDWLSRTETEN